MGRDGVREPPKKINPKLKILGFKKGPDRPYPLFVPKIKVSGYEGG